MSKFIVVAIGGNSLVKDNGRDSIEDQSEAVREIAVNIADLVQAGNDVVVTHGNGPQVGFELRRSEVASEVTGMDVTPLVNCVAGTQGGIGYLIQQALTNEFIHRRLDKKVATVITQVEVSKNDPNFQSPSKPVGSFFTLEQAEEMKRAKPDWVIIEDSGRGYRRVVPSPKPIDIVEKDVIKSLIETGYVVIAVGGGGIPVIKTENNTYEGIDAVIDKDFATSLLAEQIDAESLIITTGVPQVCVNFGTPEQKALEEVTAAEMLVYAEQGHFPAGSMQPKIEASLSFLKKEGRRVIITNPENMKAAMSQQAGTHIVN
ncbi:MULTISPECIES: carbamate kinase [Paenibacillus]|jgi:carbamate kinase|uniref:carbamate kinase n=1 Tax=Paenibacillus TaxID=44249 RepID=UPI00096C2264|nr:carbamate kinase [Paenibacillus odorifer]MEC0134411.1 carbamate kinase [Paenibacillus odorifer]MEC0222863.1 carbamate kinase [Paenibacillus odorifer]OMC97676.1 carbamate kinase [Paenibacillus odorifer]OMD18080.1 carbamate kinase [Paenibacillus odorifer]OMD57543.1 carbamate kinase [Paenibacillus odorifer]